MRKQKENMVKRANSKALEYTDQEIATLQIQVNTDVGYGNG